MTSLNDIHFEANAKLKLGLNINGTRWIFTFRKLRAMEFADLMMKNTQLKELYKGMSSTQDNTTFTDYAASRDIKTILNDSQIFTASLIAATVENIVNGSETIGINDVPLSKWIELVSFGPDNYMAYKDFTEKLSAFQFPSEDEVQDIKN